MSTSRWNRSAPELPRLFRARTFPASEHASARHRRIVRSKPLIDLIGRIPPARTAPIPGDLAGFLAAVYPRGFRQALAASARDARPPGERRRSARVARAAGAVRRLSAERDRLGRRRSDRRRRRTGRLRHRHERVRGPTRQAGIGAAGRHRGVRRRRRPALHPGHPRATARCTLPTRPRSRASRAPSCARSTRT